MGLRLERVVNAGDPGLFVPHPGHSGAPTRSITDIGQEMAAFFAEANLDTVAQSPYIGLIRAVDLLEGDGPAPANDAPRPSEAPQATDLVAGSPSEAPQATDLVAGSPLDQFAIHPIIPLALGLGLFLLLVFFFLRKVWKNR